MEPTIATSLLFFACDVRNIIKLYGPVSVIAKDEVVCVYCDSTITKYLDIPEVYLEACQMYASMVMNDN